MSSTEWYIPSLHDLSTLEAVSARTCSWHKANKLVKCSNPIGKVDRSNICLLAGSLEMLDKTESRYTDTLRSLSSLILCSGRHRLDANADAIFDVRIQGQPRPRDLSKSTPKVEPMAPTLNTSSVIAISDIQKLLGIQQGNKITCHGFTKNKTTCTLRPKEKDCNLIMTKLEDLSCSWTFDENSMSALEKLSQMIMCERFHQKQSRQKYEDWLQIIPNRKVCLTGKSNESGTQSSRHTPVRSCIAKEIETPSSIASPVFTSNGSSKTKSPSTRLLAGTRLRTPIIELPSEVTHDHRIHCRSNHPKHSSISIKAKPFGLETVDLNSQSPFSTVFRETRNSKYVITQEELPGVPIYEKPSYESPSAAMRKILKKVQSAISSSAERKPGFVYGYRRPNGVGSSSYIKIGYAQDVEKRMFQWEKQCGYKPEVIIKVKTDCAKRVERLVHLDLYTEKRKELLKSGRCNGGTGCASKHQEWFEVSSARAERIIRGWADWLKCRPYDEHNDWVLKKEWVLLSKMLMGSGGDVCLRLLSLDTDRVVVKEEERDSTGGLETVDLGTRIRKQSFLESMPNIKLEDIPEYKVDFKPLRQMASIG